MSDADDDEEPRYLDVTCILFAQDYVQEELALNIPVPCTVEHVLGLIAITCDDRRHTLLPLHTPADPQPSQWWMAFVAQPAWAEEEPSILLNLMDIDGRCFVASAPNPFDRAQILRLAQLDPAGNYEVFPFRHFHPMRPDDRYPVINAGTVTVRRAGARRVIQGHCIHTNLTAGTMWDPDPQLPTVPVGQRCLLVHGHGQGVLHPCDGSAEPSRADVAALCGANEATVRVVAAELEAVDVLCNGFRCQKVLGVTFSEDNLLTRGSARTHVTFVDCRPLLQGWSVELSEDNRLSHEELIDWLDTFSPPGWQPQVTGAPIEGGNLITQHGSVLVAEYVPITTTEGEDSVEADRPQGDSEDDSGDSLKSISDEASSQQPQPHTTTGEANAASDAPNTEPGTERRGRSRSPRRRAQITSPGWVAGIGLAQVCLAVRANGLAQSEGASLASDCHGAANCGGAFSWSDFALVCILLTGAFSALRLLASSLASRGASSALSLRKRPGKAHAAHQEFSGHAPKGTTGLVPELSCDDPTLADPQQQRALVPGPQDVASFCRNPKEKMPRSGCI